MEDRRLFDVCENIHVSDSYLSTFLRFGAEIGGFDNQRGQILVCRSSCLLSIRGTFSFPETLKSVVTFGKRYTYKHLPDVGLRRCPLCISPLNG